MCKLYITKILINEAFFDACDIVWLIVDSNHYQSVRTYTRNIVCDLFLITHNTNITFIKAV